MKKINNLGRVLFDQGWGFLVPYFLFFPFFWIFNIKIQIAQLIFIILHGFNLFLFICYLPTIIKRSWGWGLLFWLSLFLFFLIPGAYLEYPSDPWEHFRRIFSWQSILFFRDNQFFEYNKGGYFWGWTTLFWVKPIDRRWALDLYSAFWQWLWVFQIYHFAKRLGFANKWAYLQAAAFIFFFGNNLFGIRYYALSTLPIAYIAYLRSLIVIMDYLEGKRFQIFSLFVLFPIIFFNHFQEVIFFLLCGFLLILIFWYEKTSSEIKKQVNIIATIAFVGSLGLWTLNFFPLYFNKIDFLQFLAIWKYNHTFFEALGFHGLISMILAIFLLRRHPRVAILTIVPTFLLIFPPSVYLLSHYLFEPVTSYRIIYAMPTSFLLVLGLREEVGWVGGKIRFLNKEQIRYLLVVGLLLILAIPPNYPWRGRLFFQIYFPPLQRTLKDIDGTAQWLTIHRKFRVNEILFADDITDFVLTTHLGWPIARPYWYHRLYPGRRCFWLSSIEDLLKEMAERKNVRGFLVGIRSRISTAPPSLIGIKSGHWNQNLGDLYGQIPEKFEKTSEKLIDFGWKKTFVPPFYYLYEPS